MIEVSPKIVCFITDFGLRDSYVGEIHSILAVSSPLTRIIDLSHSVDPGDVNSAAYLLWRAKPSFPPGTIYLAVVDPGVGSERQAVIIDNADCYLVGPDNGLFSRIIEWEKPIRVRSCQWEHVSSSRRSSLFQGRDLFAPLAARLANGDLFQEIGEPASLIATLPPGSPLRGEDCAWGQVIYADRFGNLATDLPSEWLDRKHSTVAILGQTNIRFSRNYEEAPHSEAFWTFGSDGHIEIACRQRSASESLGVKIGEKVTVFGLTDGGKMISL